MGTLGDDIVKIKKLNHHASPCSRISTMTRPTSNKVELIANNNAAMVTMLPSLSLPLPLSLSLFLSLSLPLSPSPLSLSLSLSLSFFPSFSLPGLFFSHRAQQVMDNKVTALAIVLTLYKLSENLVKEWSFCTPWQKTGHNFVTSGNFLKAYENTFPTGVLVTSHEWLNIDRKYGVGIILDG